MDFKASSVGAVAVSESDPKKEYDNLQKQTGDFNALCTSDGIEDNNPGDKGIIVN